MLAAFSRATESAKPSTDTRPTSEPGTWEKGKNGKDSSPLESCVRGNNRGLANLGVDDRLHSEGFIGPVRIGIRHVRFEPPAPGPTRELSAASLAPTRPSVGAKQNAS